MKFTEKYAHAIKMVENWEGAEYRLNPPMDNGWFPTGTARPDSFGLGFLNDPEHCRLRPEPKMVPFGPGDIRPGMVFRHHVWPTDVRRQWWQASTNVIEWYDLQQCTYEDLQKSWFWSTDGVTWNRCEKNKEDK